MPLNAVDVSTTGGGSKFPWITIDFNVTFLQTVPGGLKIAHTFLGMVCFSLIVHFCRVLQPITGISLGFFCSNAATYFLLVTYGCFVTSLTLLLCCTLSYFTASFLPKTTFEAAYHALATLLYLTASLYLLITLLASNENKGQYKEPNYTQKIVASVLGLVNTILYGGNSYYSYKSLRQLG